MRALTTIDVARRPLPGTVVPTSIGFSSSGRTVTFLVADGASLDQELVAVDVSTGERRVVPTPGRGVAEADRPLFGFGFGTDTNGLSGQSPPRQTINSDNEVTYPFTLFSGPGFDELEDFDNVTGLLFDQPGVMDADGVIQRQWHVDRDGNAHHGMLADTVREIAIEGSPEHLQHLYNSAESYLQMWKRTEAARDAIVGPDGTGKAAGDPAVILRRAPTP